MIRNHEGSKNNTLKIFSQLRSNFTIYNDSRPTRRSLIVYADDITITTNNAAEIEILIQIVKKALTTVGLEIAESKTQIIDYRKTPEGNRFDYFGFTFLYVPPHRLKLAGILNRSDDLINRQENIVPGSHLVYPCDKAFKNIKTKVKETINQLTRKSLLEVINELNMIIRG
jgi:hypothetical protein